VTKSEQELESRKAADDRRAAKKRAAKSSLREVMAAGLLGVGYGALEARMPTLVTGFGPGGYLDLDWVLAIGGGLLVYKGKGAQKDYGHAALSVGVFQLTKPLGTRLAAGFGE
jgi:hypothetical protein